MTSDARPVPTTPEQTSGWRLIATLAGAGALAGLLIVLAYIASRPRIEAYRAATLRAAIEEVLKSPARADTLFVVDGALATRPPANAKSGSVERVYRGVDAAGLTSGYALVASEPGFADNIVLMFGWRAATDELLGIRVVSSKETPGLGDKIEKPAFTEQFAGAIAPLRGVKDAASKGSDRAAILMVTGATISSRTVIKEINNTVARFKPMVAAFEAKQGTGGTR